MPLAVLGRSLIGLGAILLVVGVGILALSTFRAQGLPGDIVWRRGNLTVYFPIVTSILLSVLISLALALMSRFRR